MNELLRRQPISQKPDDIAAVKKVLRSAVDIYQGLTKNGGVICLETLTALLDSHDKLEADNGGLRDSLLVLQKEYDDLLVDRNQVLAQFPQSRHDGAVAMLNSVIGSLAWYPNLGGDIQVVAEVERIVGEATARLRERLEAAEKITELVRQHKQRWPNDWGDSDAEQIDLYLAKYAAKEKGSAQ